MNIKALIEDKIDRAYAELNLLKAKQDLNWVLFFVETFGFVI